MRTKALAIVIALVVGFSVATPAAQPSFAVIVHGKNRARALDKVTVADAFLKKRTQWSDESVILPVDLPRSSAVRRQFSEGVLGRSVESVRTYWNRQVFSGRSVPPPELESDDAVIQYVSKNPGAIGYISANANLKDANVKIVEVR
jgi:ABC-type phosphate transport system substrate-binding protein